MGGLLGVLAARAKLYGRATACQERTTYLRANGLAFRSLADFDPIAAFCGALSVLPIRVLAGDRFEIDCEGASDAVSGAVIEAYGADGETTADLIAWPIDAPQNVLTMFGRAALLGHWQAVNSSTYIFDKPLPLHRTPLEWLQAGCDGAAIAVPHLAARVLLDVPGRIAPRDRPHAMAIDDLFRSVTRDRLVIPKARAAA